MSPALFSQKKIFSVRSTIIVALMGSLGLLAGCSLFEESEPVEVAVIEKKPELACYREARYLKLAPETCEKVGGVVVEGIPNMDLKKPDASPSKAVVRIQLPPREKDKDEERPIAKTDKTEKLSSVILPLKRQQAQTE